MKQGDVLKGFRIVTEPTNANGGKCVWAFAEKDGGQYFVKQFLDPKRPRDDDTRDTESLRIRRQVAREFEERHRTIMKRLPPDTPGGGNIVLATDFFHVGSTYYKVTERIDTSSLEKPQALEPRQKMVLLKTLGTSLKLLHDIDVVHGDLKPLNVLVQKREGAAFHTAKLIDFDDSYASGNPPPPADISGDSVYGAPEWRRYVQGDTSVSPEHLTCAVDVFALGLMTHLYLTGELPLHDERYDSPADAVNAGERLQFNTRLTDTMLGLLRATTAQAPGRRPRLATFLKALSDPTVCVLQHRRPETAAPIPDPVADEAATQSVRTSRVRGTFKPRARPAANPPVPSAAPPPVPEPTPASEPAERTPTAESSALDSVPRSSRVRINLGNRSPGRPAT